MHDLLFLVKVICVFALEPLRAEARFVGGTSKDRQVDGVVMDVSATSHGVRTMPEHASWEAPSDLVDGGMNAALALWSVPKRSGAYATEETEGLPAGPREDVEVDDPIPRDPIQWLQESKYRVQDKAFTQTSDCVVPDLI